MTTTVDGVYFGRAPRSWPIVRPRAMLDLLPQLLGSIRLPRPTLARPDIRRAVADLDRDGVAVMEGVAPPQMIEEARLDMDRFVERMPELQGTTRTKRGSTGGTRIYAVHEYQRDLGIYRSHDPLMFSPAYARFLLLPELMEVAACYLGRSWLYQAMIATRTEASPPVSKGFAQWHHDARGHKLNIILVLTDVPPDGSATVVLKGSQQLLYVRARRERNVFSDAEVAAIKERYGWTERVCHAPAGSLVLFDSHALHLGRRSPHARDAFQVNCMTKRDHLWPQEISRSLLSSLAPTEQRTLLRRANLRIV